MTLIGAFVLFAVMALTSSCAAVSAHPQDNPAVILALIAASITSQLQARGSPSEIVPTVIALPDVASLVTGIFPWSWGCSDWASLCVSSPIRL